MLCASLVSFVFRDLFNTEITKIFTKGTEENPASSVATFSSIWKVASSGDSLVNLVNWYFHSRKSMQYSRVMSDGEKQKNLKLLLVGETD